MTRSQEILSSRSRREELTGETQYFEHLGERVSIRQLSEQHGLSMMTLYQRWHRGDRGERLVRPGRGFRNGQ